MKLTKKAAASLPRLLIFASGFPKPNDRGGRGAVTLALQAYRGELETDVIGIITDYPDGSVMTRAHENGIPCCALEVGDDSNGAYRTAYNRLIFTHQPDLVVFCGWRKPIYGSFRPNRTINMHRGLYLDQKRVSYYDEPTQAIKRWLVGGGTELTTSLTINFVNGPMVDNGPAIITFQVPVHIDRFNLPVTARGLLEVVREALREAQRTYLHQVVTHLTLGLVSWEGGMSPVVVPASYRMQTDPNLAVPKGSGQLYPYEGMGGFDAYVRTIHGDPY